MTDETARRSQLLGLKLRALVRDHLGVDEAAVPEPDEFAPGSAVVHDGMAWVLLADDPVSRLGPAIIWATRRGADAVHVIAEEGTGVLARRAAEFERDISVWHADERSLLPAVPEPVVAPDPLPAHHDEFRERIAAGGAEPLVEHGVLAGEVRGLEVCRVVDDPDLGSTRLEVGVGAHDREAFQMLHGDLPAVEALAFIVETVAGHRRVGAPQHPLNRLAAERFLRWRLVAEPALVGMASVSPAVPPVPRTNLKDAVPCAAIGTAADGSRRLVVCSSGVDLDVVPFAVDARVMHESDGEHLDVTIVLPERDLLPATDQLAAQLRRPVEFVTLD